MFRRRGLNTFSPDNQARNPFGFCFFQAKQGQPWEELKYIYVIEEFSRKGENK